LVDRDVLITGIGIISALGEGNEAQLSELSTPGVAERTIDSETFAPFHTYPIQGLDLSKYIPKRGDQRAMGPFMHYGAYAAGMALEQAGVLGDEALLGNTHMVVGVGGGERDEAADETILKGVAESNDPDAALNELLLTELRPTLFLAQLPNLFAGNISIIHKVTGSSRTFMGEESAGVDALRIGFERISANQGDLFLIGSAFNSERRDLMALFNPGGVLAQGPLTPLWQRPKAGMCFGSLGVFLVIEAREHAAARGAKPIAKISELLSDRARRSEGAGAATKAAQAQWSKIDPRLKGDITPILSGAGGVGPITAEEREFIASLGSKVAARGMTAALGHGMEAAFLANIAIAALSVNQSAFFPPITPEENIERDVGDQAPEQIVVTQWGHQGGEGMGLVEKAES
jgi:3-oxoacyl-[acyl-carrier-protein] synthase II